MYVFFASCLILLSFFLFGGYDFFCSVWKCLYLHVCMYVYINVCTCIGKSINTHPNKHTYSHAQDNRNKEENNGEGEERI